MLEMTNRSKKLVALIRTLIASCETNLEELVEKLTALAVQLLPPETAPTDYRSVLVSHIHMLKAVLQRIFDAEKLFREANELKSKLGRELRQGGQALARLLQDLRSSGLRHYGEALVAALGLASRPSGNYRDILLQTKHFLDLAEALDLATLVPLDGKEALELDKRFERIGNAYTALEAKQTAYEKAVKNVEVKKSALHDTLEETRLISSNVAQSQKSFFLMADMEEQAKRLRYLAQKPPKPQQKGETSTGDDDSGRDTSPDEPADTGNTTDNGENGQASAGSTSDSDA